MIITSQYLLILSITILLAIFAWIVELIPQLRQKALKKSSSQIRNIGIFFSLVGIIWLCVLNFAFSLTLLVFSFLIIILIDQLFFAKKRKISAQKQPLIVEYAHSFFWVLLIVWIIRSFIVQPYRVPTGSLEPTIAPGDFILVNQFAYGLRFPALNYQLVPVGEPKRGDIVLFYWPVDPNIVFVKRLIGLPGDHIVYKNKTLYINGKEMQQQDLGAGFDIESNENIAVIVKQENLDGIIHKINVLPQGGETGDIDITVPAGNYFMMGDNRDDSEDSRSWGFVPQENIIGKALFVWMNWDADNHRIDWKRIGTVIK